MDNASAGRLERIRSAIDLYQSRLIAFAARITGDLESGRDVVQDTFLRSLKLRYKEPEADQSTLMEVTLRDEVRAFQDAPPDLRFAAAVAAFGMTLRTSPHRGDADFAKVIEWARSSLGDDQGGLRGEFLQMVERARTLSPRR